MAGGGVPHFWYTPSVGLFASAWLKAGPSVFGTPSLPEFSCNWLMAGGGGGYPINVYLAYTMEHANLLKRSNGKPSSGRNLHFRSRRVELLEPFLTASVWRIFGVYPVQFMKAPPAEWMCSEPLWLEPPLRVPLAFLFDQFPDFLCHHFLP